MPSLHTPIHTSPLKSSLPSPPETYILPPTPFVPNSPLPVLVYRDVLPYPRTAESCQKFVEENGWERRGPVYKASRGRRRFYWNAHECYGILSGTSQVLLGVGTGDDNNNTDEGPPGLRLTLNAGDVVVQPAGTGSSSISISDDEDGYTYMSFFPDGSPHGRSEDGSQPLEDLHAARAETLAVPIPQDPVAGREGYLRALWGEALKRYGVGVRL